MLAAKRSAGIIPEVNLRECVSHMSPLSANKAAQSSFERQSPNQGFRWPHKKNLCPQKILRKRYESAMEDRVALSLPLILPLIDIH